MENVGAPTFLIFFLYFYGFCAQLRCNPSEERSPLGSGDHGRSRPLPIFQFRFSSFGVALLLKHAAKLEEPLVVAGIPDAAANEDWAEGGLREQADATVG